MEYENPWFFNGQIYSFEDAENYVGFVYCIENLSNGRKYIGKKKLWAPKYTMVKHPKTGVKKKVKSRVESGWKDYYGSSKELQEDIARLGNSGFKRTILDFCTTLGNLSYMEMRHQMDNRVMESDAFYNGFMGGRINKKHLKAQINLNILVKKDTKDGLVT